MGGFLKRFNYYGFEKDVYSECRKLIIKSNLRHAGIITLWFALVNAFYYFCAGFGLFNVDQTRQQFFLLFMILSFLVMLLIIFAGRRRPVFGFILTMLTLVMFEVYSILSSNAEPYTSCWIFLILMVIVAVSFVGTMGRMCLILLVLSVVFCRLSYLNKPRSIASMDLANTVVVASLALVLHFAFQRSRYRVYALNFCEAFTDLT